MAEGRERRLQLREMPLELSLTAINGDQFDLASLRGKIVLLDIWALSCAGCIEAMPKIKTVYDKYREHGFEVVGLALIDSNSREKQKVIQVLQRTGASAWINVYACGDTGKEFAKQYSITSVPVTWLLDRSGRLVAANIRHAELEPTLKRFLELGT